MLEPNGGRGKGIELRGAVELGNVVGCRVDDVIRVLVQCNCGISAANYAVNEEMGVIIMLFAEKLKDD